MRKAPALVALLLLVVGCTGFRQPPGGSTPAIAPAETVAAEFVSAMAKGEFPVAARLTAAEAMAWLVMAEGASISQAASLLDEGIAGVAANFWSGFASGVQFPPVREGSSTDIEVDGVHFTEVALGEDGRLQLVLRNTGEWKVDVIASFGGTLVNRLAESAQLVASNRSPATEKLVAVLIDQRPSVEVASRQRGLSTQARQDLLDLAALLERLEQKN
jgi:hypothetical protein